MANVYCWTGGSNTAPYDTWGKAANTLQTAASAVAANDTNVYVAAETFTITAPITIVPYRQNWYGGYRNAEGKTKIIQSTSAKEIFYYSGATKDAGGARWTFYAYNFHFKGVIGTEAIRLYFTSIVNGGGFAVRYYSYNCIYNSCTGAVEIYSPSSSNFMSNNDTFYNCSYVFQYQGSVIMVNSISHTVTNYYHDGSAAANMTYSCSYDGYAPSGGTGNITGDPLFIAPGNDNFQLQRTSPCINTGDPSTAIGDKAYDSCGRVNMGAFGNTALAAYPWWAIPQGYGENYGNGYGGHITNESIKWDFNSTLSYWTISINRVECAYVDYNGTNDATMFTNTEPTTGTVATANAWKKYDATNKRLLFYSGSTIKGYINSAGAHYGAP